MPLTRSTARPTRAYRRGLLAACAATLVAATLALPSGGPAAAASVPVPVIPVGTPTSAPEALASYVPANSCEPAAKPGAKALGDLLRATYPGSSYGIDRTCGTDPLPTSEHYDGRAIDFFRSVRVPAQRAQIDALVKWLFAPDAAGRAFANARRVGVMYLIWNGRIWGSYRAADGWRPYSTCASHPGTAYDTTCHRDHLHVSLSWEGAMKRTSFWTDRTAAVDYGPCRAADLNWAASYRTANPTRCPSYARVTAQAGSSSLHKTLVTYSGMQLAQGSTGPVVRAVQQAVGTSVDGSYGSATRAAVVAYQSRRGLPATGIVDAATWRTLLSATAPAAVPVTVPTPSTGPTTAPSSPLTRYLGTTLRRGSHGLAVLALQRRLHVAADGRFGRRTVRTVKRFQRRHHLRATGIVATRTWRALGA